MSEKRYDTQKMPLDEIRRLVELNGDELVIPKTRTATMPPPRAPQRRRASASSRA